MGIEEREEVQAKGIHNILNKIVRENFPHLKSVLPIQVQEASRTPSRLDQNKSSPQHIIIKIKSTENREMILKAVREKKQIRYKSKSIKITADFSTEALKARRAWTEVLWALNENNFSPSVLYPAKLSFKIDGAKKIFHDKQKLRTIYEHQATTTEDCTRNSGHRRQTNKRIGSIKPQEKKDKKSENNIDSIAHNQILKQQKQVNGRNHHIPFNVNTKCQWAQLPHQKTWFGKLD
jgi:hypothetical protein